MAVRRRDVIQSLEILVVVLTAIVNLLKQQQASEDKLLEKGGRSND